MSEGKRWWKKTELEQPRALTAKSDLTDRVDRFERAFDVEHTRAMSLNVRGTALATASAVAILLLAQFSAIWLDDNRWRVSDIGDTALQILLVGTLIALAVASGIATIAVLPSRRTAAARRERLDLLNQGDDAAAAEVLLRMVDKLRAANERRGRLIRIASLPFAIALLGTAAQSMIFAFEAEPADPRRLDAPAAPELEASGLPAPEEQLRLARIYAPRVWLHPDERFGPLDPTAFVGASQLGWHLHRRTAKVESREHVVAARLGQKCAEAPGDCYEHDDYLARELTRPYTDRPARPRDLPLRRGFVLDVEDSARAGQSRRDPDAPVFFEVRRTPDELLITYWFFYGYSRPHVVKGVRGADVLRDRISHEGDWENIDVALTPDGSAPLAVYLYGHGTPSRVRWETVCKVGSAPADCGQDAFGHPVVYSALDSHASYALPGETKVCGPVGCATDIRDQGFRWDTWAVEDALRPVRNEVWYGYGGAWGAAGTVSDKTGPLGPRPGKLPADPDPGDLAAVPG